MTPAASLQGGVLPLWWMGNSSATCFPSSLQAVVVLPSATSSLCTSKAPVRLPDLDRTNHPQRFEYADNLIKMHHKFILFPSKLTCGSRRRGSRSACRRQAPASARLQTGTHPRLWSPTTDRFLQKEWCFWWLVNRLVSRYSLFKIWILTFCGSFPHHILVMIFPSPSFLLPVTQTSMNPSPPQDSPSAPGHPDAHRLSSICETQWPPSKQIKDFHLLSRAGIKFGSCPTLNPIKKDHILVDDRASFQFVFHPFISPEYRPAAPSVVARVTARQFVALLFPSKFTYKSKWINRNGYFELSGF